MVYLPDFPIVNQLNSPTLDGRADENREMNCVISSLVACLYFYRPDLKGKVEPDSVKDAVLGEAYKNAGTDAAWFVQYFAQFGVKLYAVAAQNLPQMAHQLIQAGLPAVFTEVDPYVNTSLPQYAGWTHVCVFWKEGPGTLTAMDPFGGEIITKNDADWPLVGNQLWTMQLMEVNDLAIDINSPGVANYFTETNGGHTWHCKQTNQDISYGMLAHYKATNGVMTLGLPNTGEIAIENIHPMFVKYKGNGITVQRCERGDLCYDPKRLIDNAPAIGDVYRLNLYTNGSPGTDPRIWTLQAQLAAAQQAVAKLDPATVTKLADYQNKMAQIHLLSN